MYTYVCRFLFLQPFLYLLPQHTFNKQFTQRYRNNRRRSSGVKCPKIIVASATPNHHQSPVTSTDEQDENVDALRKLASIKNPPAQTVQELLNVTRSGRKQWLQKSDLSIQMIFEKYPMIQQPKWVSKVRIVPWLEHMRCMVICTPCHPFIAVFIVCYYH